MKYIVLTVGTLLAALLLASVITAYSGSDRYDPAAIARAHAESERYYAQAEREAALAPLHTAMAAAWAVLPFLIVSLGVVYIASLGVAHVARFRHERMPNGAGLLPVRAEDQHTARAALAGFHAARIEEARRPVVPQVPHSLSLHAGHHRADGAGVLGLPADESARQLPGVTDLAALGFRPARESILLGLAESGAPITVPARALCHVALVGATGGGKSGLLRLLLPQLQAIGARVCLADPHHAPLDPETGEDWRPIAAKLHMAPAVSAGEIGALFAYLAEELERRMELRRAGQKVGPPLFLALDELPVIADTVPGAMDQLGRLLREGRKVGLYSVGASQSMLVKLLGGDSSAREAYRTAFYVGGDLKSAAVLLDLRQAEIAEGSLGQGVAYLRSVATSPARLVRVPWASNEAVVALLGGGEAEPAGEDQASAEASNDRPLGFRPTVARKPDGSLAEASGAQASTASVRPEAARVFALFRQGLDVAQIVRELFGVEASSGRRYQDAARQVQQLLREALEGGRG